MSVGVDTTSLFPGVGVWFFKVLATFDLNYLIVVEIVVKKKRIRKKPSRYKTGTHVSTKCPTQINYRSGWEEVVCHYLDNDPEVVSYWYESIKIPYLSPARKKPRIYIPDFLVLYKSGHTKMVEVKRKNQLDNAWVQAKAMAAKAWCEVQIPKIEYEFWSEQLILPLKKVFQAKGFLNAKSKRTTKSKSKKRTTRSSRSGKKEKRRS